MKLEKMKSLSEAKVRYFLPQKTKFLFCPVFELINLLDKIICKILPSILFKIYV